MLVDPAKRSKTSIFDQEKLAAALHTVSAGKIKEDARHLKITAILSLTDHAVELTYASIALPLRTPRRHLHPTHPGGS